MRLQVPAGSIRAVHNSAESRMSVLGPFILQHPRTWRMSPCGHGRGQDRTEVTNWSGRAVLTPHMSSLDELQTRHTAPQIRQNASNDVRTQPISTRPTEHTYRTL